MGVEGKVEEVHRVYQIYVGGKFVDEGEVRQLIVDQQSCHAT